MRVMVGAAFCRKAIVGIIGIALKHKKNTTLTKYQVMLLKLKDDYIITAKRNMYYGIIRHSNPATDFFTADIVGKNGIMTTATISRE